MATESKNKLKTPSNYFTNELNRKLNGKKSVDVSFSFRRNTRQPLEVNAVFTTYEKLEEEMANPYSSIYKGEIVVTAPEGASSTYYVPYLIKNDTGQPTSYYAERIFTDSYMALYISDYVKKTQLGTTYTGVGQWTSPNGQETLTTPLTYSEKFNDYVSNTIDDGAAYSHVEGANNTVNASYAHSEGKDNNIEATGIYSHVEGKENRISGDAAHAEGYKTQAFGRTSHASGISTIANGEASTAIGNSTNANAAISFASGNNTYAEGNVSATFGNHTYALGPYSFATGDNTYAKGESSASFGNNTYANGNYSSASGSNSNANGEASHAEGSSIAGGNFSHSEGNSTTDSNALYGHAEGKETLVKGEASHTEGYNTQTTGGGFAAHAEGSSTTASNDNAHAEGNTTTASGKNAHSEGNTTTASGENAHAEGNTTNAVGKNAHSENVSTNANADASHAEGDRTIVTSTATASHAEGTQTTVNAISAHAEGMLTTIYDAAKGSHVEGYNTSTYTSYSHAEGAHTQGKGFAAHAEGFASYAIGNNSHAEGQLTVSNGTNSHAEGFTTYSNGTNSHAEGLNTYSSGESSHSEGKQSYANGARAHAEGDGPQANGQASHAEGFETIAGKYNENAAVTSYSHAEGWRTIAGGNWSHTEGEMTGAYGTASHAQGTGSNAVGGYSSSTGFYTETFNTAETSFGTYNRSYTASELGSGTKITDIENTFAQLNGRYINGRIPSESGHRDNKYYFDSSYETLFTIGDGMSDGRTDGINPLNKYDNNGNQVTTGNVSAGDYVKNTGRHNIMDIRRNGQMYYSGGMIVGGEIAGPASYSYVASLGPTAYFTTIMEALLTQPEYYRPIMQYDHRVDGDKNGNSRNCDDGTTLTAEVGSTNNFTIQFNANRVVKNTHEHLDPIYGTELGNMLGYSTGITDIKYYYYDASKQLKSTQTESNLTLSELTFAHIDDEKTFGSLAGDVYLGKKLADGKTDDFAYNAKTANASTPTYSDNTHVTRGLLLGTEDTYTIFKFDSYTFAGASQMYFQQLADKGTYIAAAGQKALEKFNSEIYSASGTIKVQACYKYYWGISDLDYATMKSKMKNGEMLPGQNAWCNYQGEVNSTNEGSQDIGDKGTMACWVAIPAGLYELTKYQKEQPGYMWYKNAMNAESALDTSLITDTVSSARPLYDFITDKPVGTCGLKYHVYIVYVPKKLTKGTWWFKFKRNAAHTTDTAQTIPGATLINSREV